MHRAGHVAAEGGGMKGGDPHLRPQRSPWPGPSPRRMKESLVSHDVLRVAGPGAGQVTIEVVGEHRVHPGRGELARERVLLRGMERGEEVEPAAEVVADAVAEREGLARRNSVPAPRRRATNASWLTLPQHEHGAHARGGGAIRAPGTRGSGRSLPAGAGSRAARSARRPRRSSRRAAGRPRARPRSAGSRSRRDAARRRGSPRTGRR